MVCFTILFGCRIHPSEKANLVHHTRFEHLCKHYNADAIGEYEENGIRYTSVAVCDMEAVDLLRDVPQPMYCVFVKLNKQDIYLYKNYKALEEECTPPRNPFLKKIYWNASQLQRRMV